jgi:hypothetical protein
VEVNRTAHVGFFSLLIALYMFDFVWVFCQWLFGLLNPNWKRPHLPWAWAILNIVTLSLILAARYFYQDPYSTSFLAILLGLSTIAFLIDMLLVDYYDLI